jgi:hypothetical protein
LSFIEFLCFKVRNTGMMNLPYSKLEQYLSKVIEGIGTCARMRLNIYDEDVTQRKSQSYAGRGVRMYKINDQLVFLSQAESYIHRGSFFEAFSPLEFECIVDLKIKDENNVKIRRGRKKRNRFPLGENHPLFNTHECCLRTKMHTAVFGGPAPPNWTYLNKIQRNERAPHSILYQLLHRGRMLSHHGLILIKDSWNFSKLGTNVMDLS